MPDVFGIHYQMQRGGAGSGAPPLLLIHGAGGSRLSWPGALRRLPGHDVYAIDLPGHGDSVGSMPSSTAATAERLLDWQTALDLPKFIAVGHSLGGAIAQWMALRRPDRLRGLVMVGSGARFPIAPTLRTMLADSGSLSQAIEWIIDRAFAEAADPALLQATRATMLELGAETLAQDFEVSGRHDLRSRLVEIHHPTLVLAGAEDRLVSAELTQELADAIPDAERQQIAGAGHMMMLERPETVVAEIVRFIQSLDHA